MPPQQNRDLDVENGITDDNTRPRRGPKPKRKSGGREARINGEVMSISTNGAVQAAESAVEDVETPMDVDEELITDTTLDIGYCKETDAAKPLDLDPQTMEIQKKDFPLFIVKFSPSDPSRLYLGGGVVVQGNKIGEMLKLRDEGVDSINVDMATKVAEVEAFCWTTPGEAVVAIFEPTEDPHQARMSSQLVRISHWGQERTVISPVPCPVLSLHYQKETGNILCLSGGESSTVHIFHLDGDNSERRLAEVTNNTFYDTTWIGENRFIACGERKIATFTFTESGEMVQSAEITPYKEHVPSTLIRVRVDVEGKNAAVLAENMCDIFTVEINPDTAQLSQSGLKSFNVITDFEFSPKDPGRFAVACSDGLITVWHATNFTTDSTPRYQFYMGAQSSAVALAFSPDGNSIAAAGWGQLMIWELSGEHHQGEHEAKAIWQRPQGDEKWNCEPTDGDQRDWIHRLSWDPQGKQIAFGLWRQLAIIKL
jgi:WD40 repeat protein